MRKIKQQQQPQNQHITHLNIWIQGREEKPTATKIQNKTSVKLEIQTFYSLLITNDNNNKKNYADAVALRSYVPCSQKRQKNKLKLKLIGNKNWNKIVSIDLTFVSSNGY